MGNLLPPVFSLLTGDATVLSIVAQKVYPYGQAASDDNAPYITWLVVSGVPEINLSDAPDIDRHTIAINCWSKTNAELSDLASAVRSVVETVGHVTDFSVAPRDVDTRLLLATIEFDWLYARQ